MFSMNFWFFLDSWLIPGDCLEKHKFMKNIGQANVFHCFFTGIHGKHWPGQCFPLLFHRNSWKTLARPMFSMNFWFFLDSWLIPGDSLENHKFMENIGQANVFHCFFTGISLENIGQANVFHEFLVFPRFLADPRRFSGKPQIHGKHWPGQCFPLLFHRNSWKTLARPMFSMNFWIFLDFGLVPGHSLYSMNLGALSEQHQK